MLDVIQSLDRLRERNLSGVVNLGIVFVLGAALLKYVCLQHFLPVYPPLGKDFRNQEILCEKAVVDAPDDSVQQIDAFAKLAQLYQLNGRYYDASRFLERALEHAKRAVPGEIAGLLRKLSVVDADNQRFEQAVSQADDAFKLDDSAGLHKEAALDLRLSAFACYRDARATAANVRNSGKWEKDELALQKLAIARQYAEKYGLGPVEKQILDNYEALIYMDQDNRTGLTKLGVLTGEL
ncbi:MAG TPA: hypothetical protein V6C72_19970 [Chroococcales cyanobacterium]